MQPADQQWNQDPNAGQQMPAQGMVMGSMAPQMGSPGVVMGGMPMAQPIAQPMMPMGGMGYMVPAFPQTNAVAALVLGIIGLLLAFFYGIGCIFALIGVILAHSAKSIVDQNPGHPDRGMTTAALVINWIVMGIGLVMLVIVLMGVLYVWSSDLSGS